MENEIAAPVGWWQNDAFVEALDREYTAWENGNEKSYKVAEMEQSITELKSKQQAS